MTIDLRSDTVTKPTPAMLAAMASAEVGDDVYGEDPTVNRLQEEAAARLGLEAAIFVPTGTMANQTAVRAHTDPGDLILAGHGAHLVRYESGAASALSGVQVKQIGAAGFFDVDDLDAAVPPADHHNAPATLVALENTHNAAGGTVWPFDRFRAVVQRAEELGLRVHLDGARLFNAEVASGVDAARWAEGCDTVSFCFSKGLGAPVGSIVCGSAALVDRVHRFRKMFGGGMRQAGFLAAAALHALHHHVDRLSEDHANATRLAEGLQRAGIDVEPWPQTNIVVFQTPDAPATVGALRQRGVLVNALTRTSIRAVTHLDVSAADVDTAVERCREVLAAQR